MKGRMLTLDQTDDLTSSVQGQIMMGDGMAKSTTRESHETIITDGLAVPKKVPAGESSIRHYNDWPNTQGFDVSYEEREPVELKVEGKIPAYTAGTFFRTGLGKRDVETEKGTTYRVNHWFDSLAQVHRFQIHPPEREDGQVRVTYNSRSTCDNMIANIRKAGHLDGFTFGAKYDLCMSYFQKFQCMFRVRPPMKTPSDCSMSVTISANFPGLSESGTRAMTGHDNSKIQTLCNKTDNDMFQMLDPETLEPIGLSHQTVLHPDLVGPLSATHAQHDPDTGDVYNYNLDFSKGYGYYRIFHVSASTAKASILATFQSEPAYIHSLFLTQKHVILCVWNSVYTYGGMSIVWNKSLSESIAPYNETRTCKWYIIDRTSPSEGGRGLIATYESEPFFSFHSVNAYEQTDSNGDIDIIADIVTYPNLDVINRLYIDNLLSTHPEAEASAHLKSCQGSLKRFLLPTIPSLGKDKPSTRSRNPIYLQARTLFTMPSTLSPELPTISPLVNTRRHRFIYGLIHSGKSSLFEAIIKFDVDTQTGITWEKHGHTAGEPIFVPNPDGDGSEDDGVLLTVVLDGPVGKSYLLVLDARDLKELGRAHVDGVVGFGFHGTFVGRDGGRKDLGNGAVDDEEVDGEGRSSRRREGNSML